MLPMSSVRYTAAEPRPLFERVPIPKISDPAAPGTPAAPTAGSCRITPLLSPANSHTGFCTCCSSGTVAGVQRDPEQA